MKDWILPILSVLLLVGISVYDNLATIETWAASMQSASSSVQTPDALLFLANNWGLVLLVVVLLFMAFLVLSGNGTTVESENGKAMRFQSHRYIDVEIIR